MSIQEGETVTVEQVRAMTDDELDAFMKRHQQLDGSFTLPVDDFDKLSSEELDEFSERLKWASFPRFCVDHFLAC